MARLTSDGRTVSNLDGSNDPEVQFKPKAIATPVNPVKTPVYTPARGTDRQQSATVVAQNFKNARWDPEQSLDDTPIRYKEKPSLKLDQLQKAPPPSGLVYKYMPKLGG
jgi:hypothetical protein